jgi:hypothetical protein
VLARQVLCGGCLSCTSCFSNCGNHLFAQWSQRFPFNLFLVDFRGQMTPALKSVWACVWDYRDSSFLSPLSPGCIPWPSEKVILPGTNGQFDLEEGLVLPASQGEGQMQVEPSEAQEPVKGAPTIRLVRTSVQTLSLPISGRRGA